MRIFQAEAPHTDDSTLVYVENGSVLFVGDSTCDDFFTGKKPADLCRKLADTIRKFNPAISMEGHWTPVTMEDTLNDLMSDLCE